MTSSVISVNQTAESILKAKLIAIAKVKIVVNAENYTIGNIIQCKYPT